MPNALQSSGPELKRVGKFGAVGLFNTGLDFFIYNFCLKFLHLGAIPANSISTTVAMVVSFTLNRQVVFERSKASLLRQSLMFFIVTAFGLYVLQNGVIHILTAVWTVPVHGVVRMVRAIGITAFSDDFYIKNSAKVAGTVVSLSWNYMAYKLVVFR